MATISTGSSVAAGDGDMPEAVAAPEHALAALEMLEVPGGKVEAEERRTTLEHRVDACHKVGIDIRQVELGQRRAAGKHAVHPVINCANQLIKICRQQILAVFEPESIFTHQYGRRAPVPEVDIRVPLG